ncbi:MAG: ExbD/TolR family protein [Isosphaeraceae bacterium]
MIEIWITVPKSPLGPYACVVEGRPAKFPASTTVSERVVFRGFFLKLITYQAAGAVLAAPLLIGKLEHLAEADPAQQIEDADVARLPVAMVGRPVGPPAEERVELQVDPSGQLTVEGTALARADLTKELARLVRSVRIDAKSAGVPVDSGPGIPAFVALRAADETSCSIVVGLMSDCQSAGFRRYVFESIRDNPAAAQPARIEPSQQSRKDGDSLIGVRTLPVRLVADERGRFARAELGELDFRNAESLRRELHSISNDPDLPFDRAAVVVDQKLRYSELALVINSLLGSRVTTVTLRLAGAADAP